MALQKLDSHVFQLEPHLSFWLEQDSSVIFNAQTSLKTGVLISKEEAHAIGMALLECANFIAADQD